LAISLRNSHPIQILTAGYYLLQRPSTLRTDRERCWLENCLLQVYERKMAEEPRRLANASGKIALEYQRLDDSRRAAKFYKVTLSYEQQYEKEDNKTVVWTSCWGG
jgi:hypothetical protein